MFQLIQMCFCANHCEPAIAKCHWYCGLLKKQNGSRWDPVTFALVSTWSQDAVMRRSETVACSCIPGRSQSPRPRGQPKCRFHELQSVRSEDPPKWGPRTSLHSGDGIWQAAKAASFEAQTNHRNQMRCQPVLIFLHWCHLMPTSGDLSIPIGPTSLASAHRDGLTTTGLPPRATVMVKADDAARSRSSLVSCLA